jgi:hypothetical protein
MAKLTLRVDNRVVARAKQYAKVRGISVSQIVETYLAAVTEPSSRVTGAAPILRSVRGVLRHAGIGKKEFKIKRFVD